MLDSLKQFIAIKSLAGDKAENNKAIRFISSLLKELGFEVSVEGESTSYQPTLIAKRVHKNNNKKVVLYGHYDVEIIHNDEGWMVGDPFVLEEKEERIYGRGVADNKGPLIARITAIKELIVQGEELPSILWLIQGEEEVGGRAPFEVFPKHVQDFNAKIYVEETGYHKNSSQLAFILPFTTPKNLLSTLNREVFNSLATFEHRMLNKFFVAGKCPFLECIPENAYYLGFGPNDELSNIHRENESLSLGLLYEHIGQFKKFLLWVNRIEV